MIYPNIEEIKEIVKEDDYKRIPICYEIYSDTKTPIEVLRRIKILSNHCYILESVEDSKNWGRYSFLGFDPILELSCQDNKLKIKGKSSFTDKKDSFNINTDEPGKYIRQIIKENKSPKLKNLPPFSGGLVGYFAYEYIKYSEKSIVLDGKNDDSFKDVDLMLFDKVIVFDNFKQKIIIIVNMEIKDDLVKEYEKTSNQIKNIVKVIKNYNIIDLLKEISKENITNKKTLEILKKIKLKTMKN